MKKFEYTVDDEFSTPPWPWDLRTDGGWEVITIVPFKRSGVKHYRVYYKREVTE